MLSLRTKLYVIGRCKYFYTPSGRRQNVPLLEHSDCSHVTKITNSSLVKLPHLLQKNFMRVGVSEKTSFKSNRLLPCISTCPTGQRVSSEILYWKHMKISRKNLYLFKIGQKYWTLYMISKYPSLLSPTLITKKSPFAGKVVSVLLC